ncbi:MAG TPA: DUF6455 family protein [Pseudolabrys sp.]|nr:DUF6455 family protein [Pseudolabrys sp.]
MPNIAPQAEPDAVRNMAAVTEKLGLSTAGKPAAWPTGVSLLAQAIASCQRCDAGEVCADWLVRAPKTIEVPPAFCPNAPEFKRAKKAKGQ